MMTINHDDTLIQPRQSAVRANTDKPGWHRPTIIKIAMKDTADGTLGSGQWTDLHVCIK